MRSIVLLVLLAVPCAASADTSPLLAARRDGLAAVQRPPARSVINAVVGDASWIAAHGRAPSAADALREDERIATHLAWVEAELRRAEVSHLAPEMKVRRGALLDALAEYRGRARFPRNEHHAGRRPRFIDGEGNVCAVGHLIEVSAGRALAEAIDARFEYDDLLDMRDDRLAAWIARSGFTALELAMIQPSYGSARPARPAPPPEPPEWTRAELTALLARAAPAIELCAERARTIRVTVRSGQRGGTRVSAAPRSAAACVQEAVRRAIAQSRFVAPERTLSVSRTYRVRLPPEARAKEEAVRRLDAMMPAFARCMPPARPGRRAILRVRVDEAGQLSLIEAQVPVDPRSRGPRSFGADVWPPHARACFARLVGTQRIDAPPRALTIVHRLPWGGSASLTDVAQLGRARGVGVPP